MTEEERSERQQSAEKGKIINKYLGPLQVHFFALHCVTFTSIIQSGSILMCSVQKDCVLLSLTYFSNMLNDQKIEAGAARTAVRCSKIQNVLEKAHFFVDPVISVLGHKTKTLRALLDVCGFEVHQRNEKILN